MDRASPSPVCSRDPSQADPVAGRRHPHGPVGPERHAVRLAFASMATALLAACGPFAASPASAATILFVSPNSIRAGFSVTLRATCGDNVNPAFVSSGAFGTATIVPSHGILSRSVTIPPSTRPGTYSVKLSCASGQTSSATLTVVSSGKPHPHVGPHTGGGEMAATTGARLALAGGLGAIVAGLGFWLMSVVRRRPAAAR